jgi:hypothetical protein
MAEKYFANQVRDLAKWQSTKQDGCVTQHSPSRVVLANIAIQRVNQGSKPL